MVDAAQAARPHIVDGREVETKRAVPKGVSRFQIDINAHSSSEKKMIRALFTLLPYCYGFDVGYR